MQYSRRETSIRLQMMLNRRLFERGKVNASLFRKAQERLQEELTAAYPDSIMIDTNLKQ